MKKIFILVLMVLVGIGLLFSNLRADEARTIPFIKGVALHANTLIVAHGGTLHKITGLANSANAIYIVYDASSVANATGGAANSQANIITEGGEATQYDSLGVIDFGDEGLPFVNGLVVVTTTADVALLYR